MKVSDAGLQGLERNLNNLGNSTLTIRRLATRGCRRLAELKHLEELDLSRTKVTDAGLEQLTVLSG